ncbi:MAG: phosphate ABC transporter substrate-binding protein [Proteobacteria bacterium]|nr:MAG: phosphate ABC transporter substrate-binding protein [Pseudomonadota bacterium]
MKKRRFIPIVLLLAVFALYMCTKKSDVVPDDETIISGKTSILVDETLLPIIEDQVQVFESTYKAKISLIARSETEALQAFLKDTAKVIVLSRDLSAKEKSFFTSRGRFPKSTKFASDAIALIASKQQTDTVIDLQSVIDVMNGKQVKGINGLVFDNPNSGTVHYMNRLAGLSAIPDKNVYSFKTNAEVVKFVSENPGMIGVIGINWVFQPTPELENYLKKTTVLSVKGISGTTFVSPTQNNLAEGTYPLMRDIYLINAQEYEGLGIGFASFIAGERGQRIILKSGLLPVRVPPRKVMIRKEIEKKQY